MLSECIGLLHVIQRHWTMLWIKRVQSCTFQCKYCGSFERRRKKNRGKFLVGLLCPCYASHSRKTSTNTVRLSKFNFLSSVGLHVLSQRFTEIILIFAECWQPKGKYQTSICIHTQPQKITWIGISRERVKIYNCVWPLLCIYQSRERERERKCVCVCVYVCVCVCVHVCVLVYVLF